MKIASQLILLHFLLLGCGCQQHPSGVYQGYVEGEFVYVSSPVSGTLSSLAVRKGDEVVDGALLFELEPEPESTAVREAEGRIAQARARLDNLRKGLRPSEISSLEAQIDRARANLALAESEYERRSKLRADGGVISAEELDQAKAQLEANRALLQTLNADLETARLGARPDEIRAAEAEVESLTASLDRARWALDQKAQCSPQAGRVQDTIYREGEFVSAGRPVVSVLPPGNLKIRFFIPEPELATVAVGDTVDVSLDGTEQRYNAEVNFISDEAEFTPPVIFSRENRAKLVFMAEAELAPEDATKLHPGQPVDVHAATREL